MKKRADNRKQTLKTWTMVTQIGLIMIVSVAMTTALGIWIDKRLGTWIFTVLLFFLGAAGGVKGAYDMVAQIFGENKKDDNVSEKER